MYSVHFDQAAFSDTHDFLTMPDEDNTPPPSDDDSSIEPILVEDEMSNSFPRLLDVRHHFPRTAGCARRLKTFATKDFAGDERPRFGSGKELQKVRKNLW